MAVYIQRFRNLFRSPRPVPEEYRSKFLHLYLEIAWFGILGGTTQSFLGVYATRQGASTQQVGLLTAVPALVTLLISLPVGAWLGRRPVGKSVFWASVLQRLCLLMFVVLPAFFDASTQVWLIILISLIMTIPGTAVAVGFNALFADVVPVDWRAHVVGMRTGLLAIITTAFSWLSGWMLDVIPFPIGYQVVFAIGFFGAAMSSLHLYYLMPAAHQLDLAIPPGNGPRNTSLSRQIRDLSQVFRIGLPGLQLNVLRGSFARVMSLLFFFHITQFMAVPVMTPYAVNQLKYSDQLIGLGNGIFNIAIFMASIRLSAVSAKWGNRKVTAVGIMCMSSFPIIMSIATSPWLYIVANLAGGLAWATAGVGLYNYILENVPSTDRATYLAWYSMISNGAILIGSTLGPFLAGQIGFGSALILFGFGRLIAGLLILRFG